MYEGNVRGEQILIVQNTEKEGLIELRPEIFDQALGERKWGMVKIYLGCGNRYIKGMALKSADIPDGYDIIFYTRIKDDGTFLGCGQDKCARKGSAFKILELPDEVWESWGDKYLESKFVYKRLGKDT